MHFMQKKSLSENIVHLKYKHKKTKQLFPSTIFKILL